MKPKGIKMIGIFLDFDEHEVNASKQHLVKNTCCIRCIVNPIYTHLQTAKAEQTTNTTKQFIHKKMKHLSIL